MASRMIWRLVTCGPADGPTNMAMDEAIMSCASTTPTVRLYTWSPACLSIGYSQSASRDVDLEACARLGIGLVRRPTGGGAILHDTELTYSLVASETLPPVSGGILESYRKISAGLIAGLAHLGVACEVSQPVNPVKTMGAACFESPSAYEIVFAGNKLVGSAQCRRNGVLLQHGSLLLDLDRALTLELLRPPREKEYSIEASRFLVHATSLHEILGRVVSFEEAARAVTTGFKEALGIEFQAGCLTPEEERQAGVLRQARYSNPAWTMMW